MAMTGTDPSLCMSYSSDDDNLKGHQSRRLPVGSFPWNQVVRGESEPIAAATSSPSATFVEHLSSPVPTMSSSPVENSSSMSDSVENGNCYNGNMVKRPAWNKPSNGAVSEVKPVMGAVSWPALSESTRNTTKSSESLKALADGCSVPQLQVSGTAPSSSQRQISDNANTNNVVPARQNSARSDGSSASSDGSHTQQSAPQTPTAATVSHNSSPKDHTHRTGPVPQPYNVNDQPQQRTFRNRNSGSNLRGDGSHHHNHGSRREQGRGNQDWNTHRNFNGRDTHIRQRNFQRFARPHPPPNPPQFFPQPPMQPFVGHYGYPELVPQMLYYAPPPDSGLFYVPSMPPHAMVPPAPNLQLHAKIVNQIDYYFSPGNLVTDTYLRQKMDDQGWVPIKLIAGFRRVMSLTDNIQLILEALRTSSVVEVQGDKVRRRTDWKRWILPTTVEFPLVTSLQTHGMSSHDMLAEQVGSMSLKETNKNASSGDGQPDVLHSGPSFSSSGGTDQVGIPLSGHSVSAKNPL